MRTKEQDTVNSPSNNLSAHTQTPTKYNKISSFNYLISRNQTTTTKISSTKSINTLIKTCTYSKTDQKLHLYFMVIIAKTIYSRMSIKSKRLSILEILPWDRLWKILLDFILKIMELINGILWWLAMALTISLW